VGCVCTVYVCVTVASESAASMLLCVLFAELRELQKEMLDKAYHVGVTSVEDLTAGSSTFSWRTYSGFVPSKDLNSCPPDQEHKAI
jgi:hypothetical protein